MKIPGETSQEVGLAGKKTLESVKAVSGLFVWEGSDRAGEGSGGREREVVGGRGKWQGEKGEWQGRRGEWQNRRQWWGQTCIIPAVYRVFCAVSAGRTHHGGR